MQGSEENISIFLVFFAALLAVVLVLSKYLHERPVLASFIPEAAMVLAVGMLAGFVIHLIVGKRRAAQYAGNDDAVEADDDLTALLSFSPEIFFVALLPPIIFNSGLRIGTLFFRHLAPVAMFAIIGTTISSVSVALLLKLVCDLGLVKDFQPSLTELMTFGALISSTDPVSTLAVFQAKKVDPQLFYLVFGESVLNDALAIVLFDSLSRFVGQEYDAGDITVGLAQFFLSLFLNSIGSIVLGFSSGLFTALIFKQIDMRQNRLVEISLYLVLMYVPFLVAEILHLSGIVTILFTGITANQYVIPNLSAITKVNADMLFRLLAHLAETSIFLELGLSVFGLLGHWNWAFIGWSLLALLISRALNVYPISLLFNLFLIRNFANIPDLESPTSDKVIQFRRAVSDNAVPENELTEKIDPHEQTDFDEGIMFDKSPSFTSTMSEATATPYLKKDLKIRPNTAHMMWFCGLRGAVSYACARMYPEESAYKADFVMTTMALVLITMVLFGGTTEIALNVLKIDIGVDEDQYMKSQLREPVVSSALRNFDKTVIRPLVIRDYEVMSGFREHHHPHHHHHHHHPHHHGYAHSGRRPRTPVHPTIEMTETDYLDTVSQTAEEQAVRLDKLVRQDSLFDYGAH